MKDQPCHFKQTWPVSQKWCRFKNTIRYDIFTCAQNLTKWPALSSARHRNKKYGKLNNKNSPRDEIANVNLVTTISHIYFKISNKRTY